MARNIHNRIKERRQELGLSQDALGKACQVGQSTVANWERGGHVPRQATLEKIAKALKTEEVWLLSGEHSANNGPLNSYLSRPIRHVAAYNWPKNEAEFKNAAPRTYITLTTDHPEVFALLLDKDYDFDHAQLKAGTALIFTKDTDYTEGGIYLCLCEIACQLSVEHSHACTARLIYSITPH